MTTSPAWWSRPPSSATALRRWDSTTAGKKAITVSYRGVTATFNVTVKTPSVTVTQEAGKLVIALHIKVGFGLNISTITQSITHRVKDEVELATGLKVARIDVYVDDVIAD